jgi:hypothetical protein
MLKSQLSSGRSTSRSVRPGTGKLALRRARCAAPAAVADGSIRSRAVCSATSSGSPDNGDAAGETAAVAVTEPAAADAATPSSSGTTTPATPATSSSSSSSGGGSPQNGTLEQQLKAAYDSGYAQGYLRGVKVSVDVGFSPADPAGGSSSSGGQSGQRLGTTRGTSDARRRGSSSSSSSSSGGSSSSSSSSGGSSSSGSSGSREEGAQGDGPGAGGGRDSVLKSVAKGLIWRLFSTCVTVGVALVILKDSLQVKWKETAGRSGLGGSVGWCWGGGRV